MFLKSSHKSDPINVLKRMKKYIQNNQLRQGDAAWLIIDKDNWTDDQLIKLYEWSTTLFKLQLGLNLC